MHIDELTHQRIGILGWSTNNRGVTQWLLRHGATHVEILDEKLTTAESLSGIARWRLGADAFSDLTGFDVLLRAPGIPLDRPELLAAKEAGVSISSQTKLFFTNCPAPIIGVTGTNGKGTTSTLIHAMLSAEYQADGSERKAYLAGNIGKDPFDFLDELTSQDWVVLELSSFQLEDLDQSPHIAVVLSVTPDHLNHHRSLNDYHQAKQAIVAHQGPTDHAILHLDDPISASFATVTPAIVHWYSRRQSVEEGIDVVQGGNGSTLERVQHGERIPIIPTSEIALRGPHNVENVAAAMLAAGLAGANTTALLSVVQSFRGLPHRLESVGNVNDVAYVNDSIATSPPATIAALRSFAEPIVLVLGGQGKGADYAELVAEIATANVRAVVCYGTEGERFRDLLSHQSLTVVYVPMFDQAVLKATELAKPGDVVLLSPSATSYDQFDSYAKRGDQFRNIVEGFRHGA